MTDKDELKKDIMSRIDKKFENDVEIINKMISTVPDITITISSRDKIKGEIFNGTDGAIYYARDDKKTVIFRFNGEIGRVMHFSDDNYGIELILDNQKFALSLDDAIRLIERKYRLTQAQMQKLIQILDSYINENRKNAVNYSKSPVSIDSNLIKINCKKLGNKKILENLRNFNDKSSHPDAYLALLGFSNISALHYDLKIRSQDAIIKTPIPILYGKSGAGKTPLATFFIGRGFDQDKKDYLLGIERAKSQATLNIHLNKTNFPAIIDDIKNSWIQQYKENLKSYVQTGIFADRGKPNAVEMNEFKGMRSMVFTMNDDFKIDLDEAITRRFVPLKFTEYNKARTNSSEFLKFTKSVPSGFMLSLMAEIFDNTNINDVLNEVETFENTDQWINYGIKKINGLCKKYGVQEFPYFKTAYSEDYTGYAFEIAQSFMSEYERMKDTNYHSKLQNELTIETDGSKYLIYFTGSAYKIINAINYIQAPFKSATEFINNIKSDGIVKVENSGNTTNVRFSEYPKKCFCISLPYNDKNNSDNPPEIMKIKEEIAKLEEIKKQLKANNIDTEGIDKTIDELNAKIESIKRSLEEHKSNNENKTENNTSINNDIDSLPEGPVKQSLIEEREEQGRKNDDSVRVRILKDVPIMEHLGVNYNLHENDILHIPASFANILNTHGACVFIENGAQKQKKSDKAGELEGNEPSNDNLVPREFSNDELQNYRDYISYLLEYSSPSNEIGNIERNVASKFGISPTDFNSTILPYITKSKLAVINGKHLEKIANDYTMIYRRTENPIDIIALRSEFAELYIKISHTFTVNSWTYLALRVPKNEDFESIKSWNKFMMKTEPASEKAYNALSKGDVQ
jgi:hypothetical protein